MLTLFTTPNASSTMTNIGTWSSVMWDNFYNLAIIMIGFTIGGLLLAFVIQSVINGANSVFSKKDKYD